MISCWQSKHTSCLFSKKKEESMTMTTEAIAQKLYDEASNFQSVDRPERKAEPELVTCIQGVAKDTLFRTDPAQYMKNWREARGYTEEYRYPEDRASCIISRFLNEHLPG